MTTFVRPENPGTSISFQGDESRRPQASIAETVALLITHDWGPSRTPTVCTSFTEFEALFGNSDTDGRDAVLSAFNGPGVDEYAGAGSVIVYRMGLDSGGSSLAKAAKIIQNTAGTPADALTLTALHDGTRGNRLSYALEADPAAPATGHRLRIMLDDVTVERYTFTKTDIDEIAAKLNARSRYVTATVQATGTALDVTTGVSLTGGRDGTPLTVTEYEAGWSALEYEPFSVLAAQDLSDSSISASLLAFAQTQAEEQRPVTVVFGVGGDDDLDDAITRAAALSDPHAIVLGAGNFYDEFLDKTVSSAKLAPRVAGALAGIGTSRALTYLPFSGLSLVDPIAVTTDRLKEAADAGVTVFRRSSMNAGELVISRGVTTYVDDLPAMPVKTFGEPRNVRILDGMLRNLKVWYDRNIVGLPNSEPTRAAVKDRGLAELSSLYSNGLIVNDPAEPYYFTVHDPDPTQPDLIGFEFGCELIETTNFVVGVGRLR